MVFGYWSVDGCAGAMVRKRAPIEHDRGRNIVSGIVVDGRFPGKAGIGSESGRALLLHVSTRQIAICTRPVFVSCDYAGTRRLVDLSSGIRSTSADCTDDTLLDCVAVLLFLH